MPRIYSKYFGHFELQSRDLFYFNRGIPGFEDQTHYAPISIPGQEPILYLQSATREDLCWITLPARVFIPGYRLEISPEEMDALGLPSCAEPEIGSQVACQVIVTVDETRAPSANLAAPLVINLAKRLGVQSFQADAGYSFRHPVASACEAALCS